MESDVPVYYAFLDKKWIYTQSRCKKMKVLPLGPHEEPGGDALPTKQTASRRHSLKIMYMGVVAKPDIVHGFDGKILLK